MNNSRIIKQSTFDNLVKYSINTLPAVFRLFLGFLFFNDKEFIAKLFLFFLNLSDIFLISEKTEIFCFINLLLQTNFLKIYLTLESFIWPALPSVFQYFSPGKLFCFPFFFQSLITSEWNRSFFCF